MNPVRTVFLGSGGFGIPALRRLHERPDVDLVGVVTAQPRPAGRHGTLTPTELETAARELGIAPILAPERLRSPDAIASVLALEPALAVLADYGQLVPPPILDLPFGALNLHPSLLPRHRGASPIPAAILAGDVETGVSLMRMDVGLDTGPILATRRTPLGDTETRETLGARLAAMAAELLDESLVPWLQGELPEQPQPPDGTTLTRPLQREDGRLDPSQPAGELERQVRAYAGWPGTYLETDRGRLIVHQAEVAPFDATDEPGSILVDGDGLALATADGLLKLIRVQPPGGRPMSGAEYRRGRRDLPTRTLN